MLIVDSDLKQLLEANIKLANENNEMLKKLVLFQKLNQLYRVVYWVIIIGISVGAFYVIQPYIQSLFGVYSFGGGSDIDTIKSLLN